MIEEKLLLDSGAQIKSYSKGDQIFREGDSATYFYQVSSGEIKMNNFNDDGKEFIQAIFKSGQSFGEPPLFADITYPANAEALQDSTVIQLSKNRFLGLLSNNPIIHLTLTKTLATRLHSKAIMASEISSQEPEHRILRILDYLKINIYRIEEDFGFKVDLTRQQIADLTGLRVETVIRSTKRIEKKGAIKLKNHKIYR